MPRRRGRTKRVVQEMAWVWHGREEMRARLTRRGFLDVAVYDAGRISGAGREAAAAWLREHFMPNCGHEAAYELLWAGVPKANHEPEGAAP